MDLDLLTAQPMKPPPVTAGPSPANPFGLTSSPGSSVAGKPVGNPFDSKTAAPSLSQLATNNTTIGFGGIYMVNVLYM